ncbi:MAG: rubrerythrin family protein [Clostridiales bacterium]|nr:rubrerythrin family protein [Clostridiales bacterium]
MKDLKGTKTEKNLQDAFAGESQARNKYTYFASKAKKEGYVEISNLFAETAGNEKEHAEIWFKLLNGVGTTSENLEAAAAGEYFEFTQMYPTMAKEAAEEGFDKIAFLFSSVAAIEKEHNARYVALKANVDNGTVYKKEEKVVWQCSNCGYMHESTDAVSMCPVCTHPQAYFQKFYKAY